MNAKEIIEGKKILIVDDEKDVLETLVDLLSSCKIDTASSFEEAKANLEQYTYDIAVLDIMGVKGYDLLNIATEHGVPALMLTANALSEEDLQRSAREGAAYYAPKEKMDQIDMFIADVIDAIQREKSPWERMLGRLDGFYTRRFNGTSWRQQEKDYWKEKLRLRHL